MDVGLAQELLNELGSSLESLETQHNALLQFLKDKSIVTDDQLAPYLNHSRKASSVRWRAARVRLEHIIQIAAEKQQQTATQERQSDRIQTSSQKDKEAAESKSAGTGPAKTEPQEETQANEKKAEIAQTESAAPEDRDKDKVSVEKDMTSAEKPKEEKAA